MSILMEALKQQGPEVKPESKFWRNVAFILALILAVMLGFTAGYFLLPKAQQDIIPVEIQPIPASVASIANALMQPLPQQAAVDAPAVVAVTESAPVEEILPPAPAVVTVTAPAVSSAAVASVAREPEVSEELRERFASALADTAGTPPRNTNVTTHSAPAQDISMLDPLLLQQIPRLRFEAHVFATASAQRWVKVNGRSLQEGQWVTADIRLREITPHYVLLEFGQTLFSMRALSEW